MYTTTTCTFGGFKDIDPALNKETWSYTTSTCIETCDTTFDITVTSTEESINYSFPIVVIVFILVIGLCLSIFKR